jgi:hypothetical protein
MGFFLRGVDAKKSARRPTFGKKPIAEAPRRPRIPRKDETLYFFNYLSG